MESTFVDAGWDFTTPIWTIDERVDYPRLWWESIEPAELLDILTEDIVDLELKKGLENSLLVKLDTAIEKLEDNNEKNDKAAINSLQAFINTVEAQRGKKI